ncbi:hypothetical protein ACWF82_32295 [Nocardia sp. NPDC055053]
MNKKVLAIGAALVVSAGTAWLLYIAGGFMATTTPAGISIGSALVVFGVVSAWLIFSQIRFGVRADRLLRLMVEEADPRCYPEVALTPAGRVDPADASRYRTECVHLVEQSPDDWRAWFLLGGAHEMGRDHRAAVEAIARATKLQAQEKNRT